MYQKHLSEEDEIVLLIKQGAITHDELNKPDHHIETGLAHVFFFGERVFKQYKIVNDHDHFIKGVLAPTEQRFDFIERDFRINQHFSGGVYKTMYGHELSEHGLTFVPYEKRTPHVWVEMERLDFSRNLHEELLRGAVTDEQLVELGQYIARSVAESPVSVPEGLNWYDLAMKRIGFLEQFIDWMPKERGDILKEAACVATLRAHLENHRSLYERITSEHMVVSMDNHDENVFFQKNGPVFIDVVPPMESWWYGVSWINLANIVVNVEVLLSPEKAALVEQGFMEYHQLTVLPEPEYAFVKALAYVISAVHFGTSEGKEEVGQKYIEACKDIAQWL
jgi:aminoglycoside phosphotransferase family enzyme